MVCRCGGGWAVGWLITLDIVLIEQCASLRTLTPAQIETMVPVASFVRPGQADED